MKQLKRGSNHLSVCYVQLALRRAGENAGALDCIFGPQTEAAVKRFQTANGLTPDGIVGDRTWEALFPYLTGYTLVSIRRGDTFYALANRYGTTVQAIETANPTVDPDRLAIGSIVTVPLPFLVSSWEVPYSGFWNGIVLEGLRARYPRLAVESFGRSVQGQDLLRAAVGTGPITVGINASHHANEWITTPLVLRMLEAALDAEANDTSLAGFPMRALLMRARLVLTPMVNPDGVDLVAGWLEANDPAFQRAMGFAGSFPSIPFPSGWKANLNGVDLNLGYPAGWEIARAIKFAQGYTRPAPRDFVGTAPLTEPENRAMVLLTERERFDLTVSYHTQGAEIYWRFGERTPDGARAIADRFAAVSGYTVADPAEMSSYAGYKDWFIQTYLRPGYTIEAGRGQNPLPLTDLPALYRENIGIFVNSLALAANA